MTDHLPPEEILEVSRHAPYPSDDAMTLRDTLTGLPINVTGGTFVTSLAMAEGEAPLKTFNHDVLNGAEGRVQDIGFTQADHEELPESNPADAQTLRSALRLRFDTRMSGVDGVKDRVIRRGYYIVHSGVTG